MAENAVNINTASAEELARLPQIGAQTANKIVEHRQRYGNFRRPEHLLLIEGVSEKKFRAIENLIAVE